MSRVLNELEIIQNPALGAYVIWRFGLSFQGEAGQPAALPLAFLVLPLLLHRPTLELIRSTRKSSGLTVFAAKLHERRENLLAIHYRAFALRRLSLQSIAVGVNCRLLTLNYTLATIRANTYPPPNNLRLPERMRGFADAADKVGNWFSKLNLHQISSTLAVEF
jgi:hypothetical protein